MQALLNIDDIKNYLKEKEWAFVSDIRLRSSDEAIMLYVSQDKIAPKAKYGVTSFHQLNRLKKTENSAIATFTVFPDRVFCCQVNIDIHTPVLVPIHSFFNNFFIDNASINMK